MVAAVNIERVSIELTQRCKKACWFCYSGSHAKGGVEFRPEEVTAFVRDLAEHGVRAVSFGGGEPLEYAGVFDILRDLKGVLFRSLTTSGLPLRNDDTVAALAAAAPDKVHVSIHFPERESEVRRVIAQVATLQAHGIRSGVNLLVARSNLAPARARARRRRGNCPRSPRPAADGWTGHASRRGHGAGRRRQSVPIDDVPDGLRQESALLRRRLGQDGRMVLVHARTPPLGAADACGPRDRGRAARRNLLWRER